MKKKTNDNVSAKTHFLSAKCPHCGATLTIENGIDSFFCQYCGTRLILANQSAEAIKAKAAKQKLEHRENMADKVINHFNEIAARRAAEKERQRKYSKRAAIFSLIFFLIGVGLFFAYSNMQKKQSQSEEADLQLQLELIEEDINSGDYDKALVKANNLFYTSGYSQDVKKKWDNTRATLIKQIEEAKEAELDKQEQELVESDSDTVTPTPDVYEEAYKETHEHSFGYLNGEPDDEYQLADFPEQYPAQLEENTDTDVDSGSSKPINVDAYHFDVCFVDNSINTKRGHLADINFIDYEHKVMIVQNTGRDHGKNVNSITAVYLLDVSEKDDGTKILRWYNDDGELSQGYYEIVGNKVYYYNSNGELVDTHSAASVSSSGLDNLHSAQGFNKYRTPSQAWKSKP